MLRFGIVGYTAMVTRTLINGTEVRIYMPLLDLAINPSHSLFHGDFLRAGGLAGIITG